jgi:hypothetical protein
MKNDYIVSHGKSAGPILPVFQAQPDERLKKAMCQILRDKTIALPKKTFQKALNEKKTWANSLQTLLATDGC